MAFTLQLARRMPRPPRRRLPEPNVCAVWLTRTLFKQAPARHDDLRTPISGAVSRRGPADAVRRRPIHPAAAGSDRKTRSRQLHVVNPDANGRLGRRYLARGGIGAQRGLQLSDRGLEAGDGPAAAGAGAGAAAPPAGCPDSARMGRAALAAPPHLYPGAAAGRHHRDVLAAGAARTRRRSHGRLDAAKIRAGAVAAEHRGSPGNCRFEIAAAACRRQGKRPAGDRPFRIDLSGQAAQGAARDRRHPEATRPEAADRLCRIVHPRHRQGRGRLLRPRRRAGPDRRRHRQRLCRLGP